VCLCLSIIHLQVHFTQVKLFECIKYMTFFVVCIISIVSSSVPCEWPVSSMC
jgi:hypothetical protein